MEICPSCHNERHSSAMRHPQAIVPAIRERLQRRRPHWNPADPVCQHCISEATADEAAAMIEDPDETDMEVIDSLRTGAPLAMNVAEMDDAPNLTRMERWADALANTVGSFKFSATILLLVAGWLVYAATTGMVATRPAVVFGGLSSALGTLAAIQNPIILMSQRRAARRDRLRNLNDYQVNLKAELEIRALHEKIDYALDRLASD